MSSQARRLLLLFLTVQIYSSICLCSDPNSGGPDALHVGETTPETDHSSERVPDYVTTSGAPAGGEAQAAPFKLPFYLPWEKKEPWKGQAGISVFECRDLEIPRLPTRIRPSHYELKIDVDRENLRFGGNVTIDVTVGEPKIENGSAHVVNALLAYARSLVQGNQIILNVAESLDVEKVWYQALDTDKFLGVRELCRQGQYLKITLDEKLADDTRGRIFVSFKAPLNDDMKGFYMTSRMKPDGNKTDQKDAVTQFQATEARAAFPCFDEPSFKATYSLTLTYPSDLVALANTKVVEEIADPETGLTRSKFAQTPVMSSYLLAFTVGEYDHLERKCRDDQLQIRVFTSKGRAEQGQMALDVACKSILAMEEYTNIQYPLDKLDLLAVHDFSAGAMENWGLVVFRDEYLYYDPLRTDLFTEEFIAKTVAHELAHQWFGNLVTMNWWTELWLNEAFAECFAYKVVAKAYPKLDYERTFLRDNLIAAFDDDSGRLTHPLQRRRLESNKDIEDNFDGITYNKGCAVLAMLENVIGSESMQEALRNYLKARQFSNSLPKDLLTALSKIDRPGVSVVDFLNSWINQAGFPLIKVDLDIDSSKVVLQQARFIGNEEVKQGRDNPVWHVPISVIFGNSISGQTETVSMMMTSSQDSIILPSWFKPDKEGSWLKVNKDFKGFYYVKYSESLFEKLKAPLAVEGLLSASDKFNLVHELEKLVESKQEPIDKLMQLMTWTVNENVKLHGVVWKSLTKSFGTLKQMLGKDMREPLRDFAIKLFSPIYNQFGFRKSSEEGSPSLTDDIGRPQVFEILIASGHEAAIKDALDAYAQAGEKPVDSNLRGSIYLAVAQNGSDEQFSSLIDLYKREFYEPLRYDLVWAIVRPKNKSYLRKAFEWIKASDLDDKDSIVAGMANTAEGRQFLIDAIYDVDGDFKELKETIGEDNVEPLIKTICLSSEETVDSLFLAHPNMDQWLHLMPDVEAALEKEKSGRADNEVRARIFLGLPVAVADKSAATEEANMVERAAEVHATTTVEPPKSAELTEAEKETARCRGKHTCRRSMHAE